MYISEHDNRGLRSPIVWLVVIVCHTIILQFLWLRPTKKTVSGDDSILVLLPVNPLVRSTPDNKSVAGKAAARVHRTLAASSAEQKAINEADASQTEAEPRVLATPAIDWRAAAEMAARQAARASAVRPAIRSFGDSSSSSSPLEPSAPGVFTEPRHRFGETSTMVNGDSVLWLSEHCYQVLNSDESRFRAFSLGTPDTSHGATRCTYPIGKPKANGELFKHLKPKALE